MKKLFALSALLALSFYPAAVSGQQQPQSGYKPELIEFMIFTQIRHTKLWLAGNAGNWELADYEIDELKEVLENAAKHVPDYNAGIQLRYVPVVYAKLHYLRCCISWAS